MNTKRTVTLLTLIAVLMMPAMSAQAAYVGTFSISASEDSFRIDNGYWWETFGPAGQGTAGGYLSAYNLTVDHSNDGNQWSLAGVQTEDATGGSGVYQSVYSVTMTLSDTNKFGLSAPIDIPMNATNTSYHDPGGNLTNFTFTANGVYDLYRFSLIAEWSAGALYPDPLGDPGHASINWFETTDPITPFTTLSLDVVAVPVPAPLLLLASGLVGLIGVGRRRFLKIRLT